MGTRFLYGMTVRFEKNVKHLQCYGNMKKNLSASKSNSRPVLMKQLETALNIYINV